VTWVVDASVALKWFLQEPGSDAAATLLDRSDLLIAPDLIVAEMCNAGWKAVRTGVALREQIEIAAARLPMVLDELVPLTKLTEDAVAAAFTLDHPVYDCFYLALAEQRDSRLVTADQRLLRQVAHTRWAGSVTALSDLS
jgi:predicted nucleic acid-binding protein